MIRTRDWNLLERLLRDRWMDPELEEALRPRGAYRWHIRIVLQDGERLYLNLLVSQDHCRGATKLGRESKEDGCMHLRDVNGIDVPISVDIVNTTAELVSGEILPPWENKPDMVLTLEDTQCLWGMMLTGWKKEYDLLKGWASQGVKKDQIPQGTRSREAGEQARAENLQVKIRCCVTSLKVLFDKSMPDTVIRYGMAVKLGLKIGGTGQWVTTVDGKKEYSRGLYHVPLLGTESYIELVRANVVRSTAHIETGRTVIGIRGDLPDVERGTMRVTWEWECADMVIGRDNPDCQPVLIRGWPKEGTQLEVIGPMGLYTRKDLGEVNRRN